jgi:hypothetical protein
VDDEEAAQGDRDRAQSEEGGEYVSTESGFDDDLSLDGAGRPTSEVGEEGAQLSGFLAVFLALGDQALVGEGQGFELGEDRSPGVTMRSDEAFKLGFEQGERGIDGVRGEFGGRCEGDESGVEGSEPIRCRLDRPASLEVNDGQARSDDRRASRDEADAGSELTHDSGAEEGGGEGNDGRLDEVPVHLARTPEVKLITIEE